MHATIRPQRAPCDRIGNGTEVNETRDQVYETKKERTRTMGTCMISCGWAYSSRSTGNGNSCVRAGGRNSVTEDGKPKTVE